MRNNKGFTLVELLAVIVILAVIMLIAVTSVGPMMDKARKSAFLDEGMAMVKAAQTAYAAEQLNNTSKVKSNSTVCFNIDWLKSNQYFTKGSAETYNGSVLITYNTSTKKYSYTYYLSNGAYYVDGIAPDVSDPKQVKDGAGTITQLNNCKGSGTVKCLNTSGNACT